MGETLAVDLGGTNMRAAAVDATGAILDRAVVPTPRDAATLDPFLVLVEELAARHEIEHAVVAVPGRVDHERGLLLHAPNLPACWPPLLTRAALEEALGRPVALANDADVAAVGEARFGAGRGHGDVVYLTISTGVGAGVIVGGRLMLPRYSGGEVGHSVVEGALAAAGEDGTVEGLGSGTAINRMARAAGLDAIGPEIVRLVQAGDAVARQVWDEAMFAVALGVVNLAHLVAPTIVVIGGGAGRNGELVHAPIRAALERLGPAGPRAEVVGAALGDDSGLIGAAAWRTAT